MKLHLLEVTNYGSKQTEPRESGNYVCCEVTRVGGFKEAWIPNEMTKLESGF